MRYLFLACVLALAGCPVQVDTVNVNQPNVDVDADARANVNVNGAPDAGPAVEPVVTDAPKRTLVAAPDAGTPAEPGDDFDGDGLPNQLDRCPVDGDSDSDGKCDNEDPCPRDAWNDRDRDGLCDSADPCPDGPFDRDHDGVCDGQDKCPVDAADDSDGDGTCDSDDECPADAGDDSDGDGSCDSADLCADHDDALDADEDGTPDGCDVCPAGTDADADNNGYADGCEGELWSTTLETHGTPVVVMWNDFEGDEPAEVRISAANGIDCWLENHGSGYVKFIVPAGVGITPRNPWTYRVSAAELAAAGDVRGAKLFECLEAGQIANTSAVLADGGVIVAGPDTAPMIKHIAYLQVTVTVFDKGRDVSGGTWVGGFHAVVSAHGY